MHRQLPGGERRGHIHAACFGREPQNVPVELVRVQRSREQHACMRGGPARREESLRDDISQAERRALVPESRRTRPGRDTDIEQRVFREHLREPAEMQGREVRLQNLGGQRWRVLIHNLGRRGDELLQCAEQRRRNLLMDSVWLGLRVE